MQTSLTFDDYVDWKTRMVELDSMPVDIASELLKKFVIKDHMNLFKGFYGRVVSIELRMLKAWFARNKFKNNITRQDIMLFDLNSEPWRKCNVDFSLLYEAKYGYAAVKEQIDELLSEDKDPVQQGCYTLLKAEWNYGMGSFGLFLYRLDRDEAFLTASENLFRKSLSYNLKKLPQKLKEWGDISYLKHMNCLAIALEYHKPEESVQTGKEIIDMWETLAQEKGRERVKPETLSSSRARLNFAERTKNLYEPQCKKRKLGIDEDVAMKEKLREALNQVKMAKLYFDLYPLVYIYEYQKSTDLVEQISSLLE